MMPKQVPSPPSSEDEADNSSPQPTAPKQTNPEKKTSKYQCPEDFVTFHHEPCRSTLTDRLKDKNTELWLIKAPVSFKPERFSGLKVPLSGLQTLRVPADGADGGQQIYSVLASNHCSTDLRLLTARRTSSDDPVFSPAFSGLLNVCESYGDSSANQAPQVIPAAPAPSIPPGLKQRFHPFGSKTPTLTCVAENEVDGAAFGPSSATLRPLVVKRFVDDAGTVEDGDDEEEENGEKKKKKKGKRIKTEHEESVVSVKQEPGVWLQEELLMGEDFLEDEHAEDRRKKKRKKRDREREEVEEGLEPSVSIKVEAEAVKSEPADCWDSEAAEGSAKKKKKKKKKCKVESD